MHKPHAVQSIELRATEHNVESRESVATPGDAVECHVRCQNKWSLLKKLPASMPGTPQAPSLVLLPALRYPAGFSAFYKTPPRSRSTNPSHPALPVCTDPPLPVCTDPPSHPSCTFAHSHTRNHEQASYRESPLEKERHEGPLTNVSRRSSAPPATRVGPSSGACCGIRPRLRPSRCAASLATPPSWPPRSWPTRASRWSRCAP